MNEVSHFFYERKRTKLIKTLKENHKYNSTNDIKLYYCIVRQHDIEVKMKQCGLEEEGKRQSAPRYHRVGICSENLADQKLNTRHTLGFSQILGK